MEHGGATGQKGMLKPGRVLHKEIVLCSPLPQHEISHAGLLAQAYLNVRGQEAALIFCLLSASNLLFIMEKSRRNQVKGGSKITEEFATLTRAGGWDHIPTRLRFLNRNRDVSGQTEH